MKRLIAPLVLALAVTAPAQAQAHSKKAKTYRGTFQFVGADGGYVSGNFGKAQMVDGKRNDKLSVHVRRLAAKHKYMFKLQQGVRACEAGAPAGTDVAGWKYRHGGVMKTNRKGVANSSARSKTFTAQRGVEYFVGVYDVTTSELVVCAELRTKKAKKPHVKHKPVSKPKPPVSKPKPHVEDKPAVKDKGKSDETPRGKGRDDKPDGKSEDKGKGKSDDTPRGKGREKKPR